MSLFFSSDLWKSIWSSNDRFTVGALSHVEEEPQLVPVCHCKYTKEECRTDGSDKGQCCCADKKPGDPNPPDGSTDVYLAPWWKCTHIDLGDDPRFPKGRNRGIKGCVLVENARCTEMPC